MEWTEQSRRDACLHATMGRDLLGADSQIIERPGWYQVVTPSAPGSMGNEVVLSQLTTDDADGVIQATVAQYGRLGKPTKWSVGYWTRPADFGERLTRAGFSHWDVRGMGCDTSAGRGGAEVAFRVEEVSASTLDAFVAAEEEGWGLPRSSLTLMRQTYLSWLTAEPRAVHFFLAREGREVVGTGGLLLCGASAYLFGTQVLAQARGRGAYRALVARRLAFLRDRGVTLAVTQAREETSAPILERVGFETLFRSRCYQREWSGS